MLILSRYIFMFKKNNDFTLAISFRNEKMLIYVTQVDN